MALDTFDEAAQLIAEVGAQYARGRRYRAIADALETGFLGRALQLGGELRTLSRTAAPDSDAPATIVAELRRIVDECDAAIAAVQASDAYRAAVAAWDAARLDTVAELARELFDGVVEDRAERPLYAPVIVTRARGGGEHFLSAAAVAERIAAAQREGVAAADPPPERGADDRIRAVLLDDDPDAATSPITLVWLPGTITLPRARLAPAGEVLVYAPRLDAAATRVRCARDVSDEWWAVRPDAYPDYVGELTRELAARGITDVDRA